MGFDEWCINDFLIITSIKQDLLAGWCTSSSRLASLALYEQDDGQCSDACRPTTAVKHLNYFRQLIKAAVCLLASLFWPYYTKIWVVYKMVKMI